MAKQYTVQYKQVSPYYKAGDYVTDTDGNVIGVYIGDGKVLFQGDLVLGNVNFKKVSRLRRWYNYLKYQLSRLR